MFFLQFRIVSNWLTIAKNKQEFWGEKNNYLFTFFLFVMR